MKNNFVKILATLGLIIAIALILKGVFDVGKIGIKSFSNKKTITDLPILECEFKDDVVELMLDDTASLIAGDIENQYQQQRGQAAAERNN